MPEPGSPGELELGTDRSASAGTPPLPPPAGPRSLRDEVMVSIGGTRGLFDSSLPVLVFVLVDSLVTAVTDKSTGLSWALVAAVASGVGVLVLRLVRRETPRQALSGFLPLALAAYLAHRSGSARDFYLPYILWQVGYALVLLVSVVVRQPLVGHVYSAVEGADGSWRTDRRARRAFALATLGWVVVFALRAGVQGALYAADHTGWLAAARLVMGWPLTIAAAAATVAWVKRLRRA